MPEKRFKNKIWNLGDGKTNQIPTWQHVQIAVLMDIRDELQTLNGLLDCPNFTRIPLTLREIRNGLRRKRKKRPLDKKSE